MSESETMVLLQAVAALCRVPEHVADSLTFADEVAVALQRARREHYRPTVGDVAVCWVHARCHGHAAPLAALVVPS